MILIYCIISNIAIAEWITSGDYEFNATTKEFWNNKLSIGGILNNDQTLASLQTNDTIEILNEKAEALLDEPTGDEPLSIYDPSSARRMNRSDLFRELCNHFKVPLESWQCHNVKLASMATFGVITKLTARGEQVMIQGFGRFYLHHYPQRIGRNPKSGVEVTIPAQHRLFLRPSEFTSKIIENYSGHTEGGTLINPIENDLLDQVPNDLMSNEGDSGFTATTNIKPPPPIVKVTTTVDPSKGVISPTIENYQGSKFTISVIAKDGWKFIGWNHESCASGIIPNTPITCEPLFEKLYKLTWEIIGNGTVKPDTSKIPIIESGKYYKQGQSISLYLTPATGYKLKDPKAWQAICSGSFNMPAADTNCVYEFIPK